MNRHVSEVFANDREDAVRAADGGVTGTAILDDQQARLVVFKSHMSGLRINSSVMAPISGSRRSSGYSNPQLASPWGTFARELCWL